MKIKAKDRDQVAHLIRRTYKDESKRIALVALLSDIFLEADPTFDIHKFDINSDPHMAKESA